MHFHLKDSSFLQENRKDIVASTAGNFAVVSFYKVANSIEPIHQSRIADPSHSLIQKDILYLPEQVLAPQLLRTLP